MAPLEYLLGEKLIQDGPEGRREVNTATLRGVVGVYFSAHWCGPCRSFTPQLRKVYERAKSQGKAFEVIFMSSDRDERSFNEYFATMPWHAFAFADRGRHQQLTTLFQVQGIPSLVLLDWYTGRILESNARGKVMEPGFISTLPRSVDLDAESLPEPSGGMPIRIRYQGKEFELECEPSCSAAEIPFLCNYYTLLHYVIL